MEGNPAVSHHINKSDSTGRATAQHHLPLQGRALHLPLSQSVSSMDALSAALLFVLLTAARCAPAGLQDACAEAQTSSLDLNQFAKTASAKARNGSTDLATFSSSVVWMEAKDKCDPESLKHKPMPCVGKIFSLLTSYISAVERVSGFESCTDFTSIVKPPLKMLHRDMSKCMRSLGGNQEKEPNVSKEEPQPIEHWKEAFLCRYTLDRLFSFSILTARVFAVGDPAHHMEGSTQRCS